MEFDYWLLYLFWLLYLVSLYLYSTRELVCSQFPHEEGLIRCVLNIILV